jgi:anti-sigma B factor antagonist
MSVFEVRIEGDARVMVSGELDMASSSQLTNAVESLASTESKRVVVDLSGVTFLDSTGASALCLAKAKLDAEGAVLVLGPVSARVEAVLRMVGLEREFVRDVPTG